MTTYNYNEEITKDIINYIKENDMLNEYPDLDDLREVLNDELWTADDVTGNGSGSYTFSRQTAKEYVEDNIELIVEMASEFCVEPEAIGRHFLEEDWEYFDVSIRCYLLSQCIEEAMEMIEEAAA